jgi:hypothetical protein
VTRARGAGADSRPSRYVLLALTWAALVAACSPAPSPTGDPTGNATASIPASGTPATSEAPTSTPAGSPSPSDRPGTSPTPDAPTATPGDPAAACSGSVTSPDFFRRAAAAIAWPVYCAVLPGGWFIETGKYRLADGGRLEITYRGPGDARLSLVEGNVCEGTEVDVCAPRDAVLFIGVPFADREGELGRLANGLVLDVDRGAMPSWRATGLGLSEEAFRAICAALLVVAG